MRILCTVRKLFCAATLAVLVFQSGAVTAVASPIEIRVSAGTDDAEEKATGGVSLGSTDLISVETVILLYLNKQMSHVVTNTGEAVVHREIAIECSGSTPTSLMGN